MVPAGRPGDSGQAARERRSSRSAPPGDEVRAPLANRPVACARAAETVKTRLYFRNERGGARSRGGRLAGGAAICEGVGPPGSRPGGAARRRAQNHTPRSRHGAGVMHLSAVAISCSQPIFHCSYFNLEPELYTWTNIFRRLFVIAEACSALDALAFLFVK